MAFGSSSNYFIAANQQVLSGLTITVDVTEDIVPVATVTKFQPQPLDFTLQMNFYAGLPGPAGNSVWQQCVFRVRQHSIGPNSRP